jgi:hypothetical protein
MSEILSGASGHSKAKTPQVASAGFRNADFRNG